MNHILKAILIVVVALLAWTAWQAFANDQRAEDWEREYNVFRDSAISVTYRADSLERQVAIFRIEADEAAAQIRVKEEQNAVLTKEIVRLTDLLRPISGENEKTFNELTEGQDVQTVVARSLSKSEPWIRLSFGLRNENILLKRTNLLLTEQVIGLEGTLLLANLESTALRKGLILETQRADMLQAVIDSLPEPPGQEKFLGIIPLPSRKASLWIGVAGGVVTSAIIVSAFND